MKKLLVFLTACAMMSVMFSCGEKEESSGSDGSVGESSVVQPETHAYDESVDKSIFTGKWECCRLIINGNETDSYRGMPSYAVFQYDIHEDGTVTLPDSLMEISDPANPIIYTWGAISDTEIEIVGSNGSVIAYELNDGKLENIGESQEIYLEKVDEFQYFDFKSFYEEMANQFVLTPVETDAAGNIIGEGEPVTVGEN
ncbi:MAG: hypothetical protein HDT23_03985 [Ruminococcus sp.]|nr:hypothetical protein [Ruminococcus sp.]